MNILAVAKYMKWQRNYFMQGKAQDASWGEGVRCDDLEARHMKIHPDNEHHQLFPSIKYKQKI